MATESLRTVKDGFSEFVERVHRHHERVTVTKHGQPAAVLMSVDDLAALEETLAVLGDSDTVRALAVAERAIRDGDVVVGVDAVRALRPPA